MIVFCNRELGAAFILSAAIILGSCATAPRTPVWAHYDACAAQTSTFVAMAECGKQRRTAYCQAPETATFCGAEGTAFVQYVDALAQSVQNHEISDAQALQRFAEYKTTIFQGLRQNRATVAAGALAGAASVPTPVYTPTPIIVPPLPSR